MSKIIQFPSGDKLPTNCKHENMRHEVEHIVQNFDGTCTVTIFHGCVDCDEITMEVQNVSHEAAAPLIQALRQQVADTLLNKIPTVLQDDVAKLLSTIRGDMGYSNIATTSIYLKPDSEG